MQSLFPTAPSELSRDDLAELYAYPSGRHWVRANFVSSLDGSAQGSDHKSGSLSGRADQMVFQTLRSLCDAIVVGAGTTRVEGYQPVQHSELRSELRSRLGLAPVPTLAVISRSLHLSDELIGGGEAPTVVITTESAPADERRRIAERAHVIVAGAVDVDLAHALDQLHARGYQRVLCEGGPSLMRELVASGCLDELCLTIEPLLVAGSRVRITDGEAIEPPQRMRLRHLLESDGVLLARYTKGSD